MVQWLGVRLPVQGTRVLALSRRVPHAAERLGLCATTTEPALWSPRAMATEARVPGARALQREAMAAKSSPR